MSWHLEVIVAKLKLVRQGRDQAADHQSATPFSQIVDAPRSRSPPGVWGTTAAQLLCVSYAQDLSDKLARDCRRIMMSRWYRGLFPRALPGIAKPCRNS